MLDELIEKLRARFSIVRMTLVLIALMFIVWLLFFWSSDDSAGDRNTVAKPNLPATTIENAMGTPSANEYVDRSTPAVTPPVVSAPSVSDEIAKARSEAIRERVKMLTEGLAQVEEKLSQWQTLVIDLSANDSGRRIANNANLLPVALTLLETEIVPEDKLSALRTEIRIIENILFDNAVGSVSTQADVGAINKAWGDLQAVRELIDRAFTAMASIERESRLLAPADITLGEAKDQNKSAEALKWARATEASKKKVEREADETLAAVEADNTKTENDMQLAEAIAKNQRLQDEAEKAIADAAARAVYAQLESEFQRDLPQIRHYLARLFEHSITQPKSFNNFTVEDVEGPMSLAGIKAYGALDSGEDGYRKFLLLMMDGADGRTVVGPYPYYMGQRLDPHFISAVRPGYTLLKKYQQILVDKGMLLP